MTDPKDIQDPKTKKLALKFSDNELKAIAVNSMGRASEAGVLSVMRLGLAVPGKLNSKGAFEHAIPYPTKGNTSGYTIGFFQWDVGAKKNGREIIDAYNSSDYVKANPTKKVNETDIADTVSRLEQNRDDGPKIKSDIRNAEIGQNLNAFFKTAEGYRLIMTLQNRQFENELKVSMEKALLSPSVQAMNREDAQITLAAIAKLKNQAGHVNSSISKLLEDPKTLVTKDDVLNKIYALYPNTPATETELAKENEVQKGVKTTVLGAELYNKLSNDKGALGTTFRERNASNPLDIPNFRESPKDQLIDAMFRSPASASRLIDAVNQNKDSLMQVGNGIANEAYTIGIKEGIIFTIDKDGKGYQLNKGEWKAFDNTKEPFLHQDQKTNKWALEAPVLEKGSKGENVRELQNRLNAINPADKQLDVTPDAKVANFGPATEKAVREFQKEHKLPDTGKFDKATQARLSEVEQAKVQTTIGVAVGAAAGTKANSLDKQQIPELSKPDLKINFLEIANKIFKLSENEKGVCLTINGKDCDLSSFKRFGETMTTMQTYQNGDRSLLGKFLPESDQFELYHRSAYGADKIAIVSDFSQQQLIQLNNLEATKDKPLSQQKSTGMER